MAGILQLRRGLKSTYISEGTNLAEAFFVTTAETGSVSKDTLIVGISGSTGNDVITLAKLSLANKDNSYADYNSGSFWITGDYTGSNALIHKNLIVSGNTYMEGDLHLEGHMYLGSGSDGDVVTVKSDFSGSLIPDNDAFGSLTPDADTAYHDLGTGNKRWKNLFLQSNTATGSVTSGFVSASHIDLTGRIWADGEGRFGTLRLDDITDNRILLAGTNGRVIDDANLTYDGQDFRLTNSDYYQIGTGASFQFDGAGMDITGSISNYQLRVDNGIVFTNAVGTLDNQSQFTWDGGLLNIDGGISASQNLSVDGETTLASAIVKDLTENRIVIAGPVGEIEDDQYFRYTGNEFIIGSDEHFKVVTLTGNTFISGAVQMFSTLNVDDQSTLASANIEDLTDNRVVIVGTGGELEDDGNFTFDGTELNIGTGNFTVQQGSGNTHIVGDVDIDSDLNVDGGDITTNQSTFNLLNGNATTINAFGASTTINIGTGGAGGGETSINHDLSVIGNTTISGNLTVSGTTTQLDVTNLNVEDKNILIASGSVNATAANGAGITIDGADATILYSSANDSFQLNKQVQVEGNISGSSFNGTTLLSSSNENFAEYSSSVDSRLDTIEGPMSTSLDSRLVEIFVTGSDHETRLDTIEGSFSTSLDSRLDLLESFSSSIESHLPSGVVSGSDQLTSSYDSRYALSGSGGGTYSDTDVATYLNGNLDTNIIPDTNASYDIGSAEFKIRHLYLSDNSIKFGENQNSLGTNVSNQLTLNGEVVGAPAGTVSGSSQVSYVELSNVPAGIVSGSDQVISSLDSRYVQSGSITGSNVVGSDSVTSIETMTSASYAAITPVSGTLYIIVD